MIKSGMYINPVLLTLTSWENTGEEIVSAMPDIPQYSIKEIEPLLDNYEAFPSGYDSHVSICREDHEVVVNTRVTLPSFDKDKAITLADRMEKFIEGELSIIEYGY